MSNRRNAREITHPAGKYHAKNSRAWSDAERQRLLEDIANLPDPVEYARGLPLEVALALLRAHRDDRALEWWVGLEDALILIPYGLCEAGPPHQRHVLGAFPRAVLRELKKDWK